MAIRWLVMDPVVLVEVFYPQIREATAVHQVGIISMIVLAIAILVRYVFHLATAWRRTFQKVPALKAVAPTQSEPPFAIVQLTVLAIFITLGFFATKRFREVPLSRAERVGALQ